ncbi:hypothetical protein JCM16496A_25760 [Bacteroides rodentium JCM 16496]
MPQKTSPVTGALIHTAACGGTAGNLQCRRKRFMGGLLLCHVAITLQCHCKRDAESLQYGEADKQDTRTYAYKETPHPYIVDDASGRKSVYGSAG